MEKLSKTVCVFCYRTFINRFYLDSKYIMNTFCSKKSNEGLSKNELYFSGVHENGDLVNYMLTIAMITVTMTQVYAIFLYL